MALTDGELVELGMEGLKDEASAKELARLKANPKIKALIMRANCQAATHV